MKKAVFMCMVVMMALIMAPAALAANPSYADVDGHWAATAIEEWSNNGIIEGSNGAFRPDDAVTRGELAVILNCLMKYQVVSHNSFQDISNQFYADAILKAHAAGVIKGNPNGTAAPKANITRQDAVVMIARAFALSAPSNYTLKMSDAAAVSTYAKDSVAALEFAGYISGRGDGRFEPKATITRAEIVKILDNMITGFYSKAGTYSENISGTVLVNVPNVILKNLNITGNLVIAPGVGEGDCILDNVKISGNTVILGGGSNSIKIINGFTIGGSIIIKKDGNAVRVFAADGITPIPIKIEEDGTSDVILEGSFSNVQVQADVKVTIPASSTITNLSLESRGAAIDNVGTISTVTVTSEATKSTIVNTGVITTANIQAPITVSGSGTIKKAILTAASSGASFANMPASLEAPSGTKVTVGNVNYVSNGSDIVKSTDTSSSGGGSSTTYVSSVMLFINNDSADTITVTPSNGTATFNLAGLSDTDKITGIEINTNKSATYTVDKYSIDTNTIVSMSTFFKLAGLGEFDVTLGRIRVLGSSFTVDGVIGSSTALTVAFNVKPEANAYYTYKMEGTTLTATLLKNKDITTALGSCDPVACLVGSLSATDTYVLKVKKNSIVSTIGSYTKAQLSGMDINDIVKKLDSNTYNPITDLNGLKGLEITLSGTNNSIKLIFAS